MEGREKPTGAAFLRAAASPPRDLFVQDVRTHWTTISTVQTPANSPTGSLLQARITPWNPGRT